MPDVRNAGKFCGSMKGGILAATSFGCLFFKARSCNPETTQVGLHVQARIILANLNSKVNVGPGRVTYTMEASW
jgi:hypothetical protein